MNRLYPWLLCSLIVGLLLGAFVGSWFQKGKEAMRIRTAVGVGPYSDNFHPARVSIAEAMRKLSTGDTNDVVKQLKDADDQIRRCEEWTDWFMKNY